MTQVRKSIHDFKKNDIITRISPIIEDDDYKDYSLVGTKLTFLGIANACVYLSKKTDMLTMFLIGKEFLQIKLPVETCEYGWTYYIEPDFLVSGDEVESDLSSEEEIRREIEKASENEDYLKADTLKKKLDELINKKKNGNG
jgi:hypothetical protein